MSGSSFVFADWLNLFLHYFSLSLLTVGGAISTAPEMHRYLVDERHWLTETQFSASISIAQAAPGPNVLFIALMGWNVGMNSGGGFLFGLLGVLMAMGGILIPSTALTYLTARWSHANRNLRAVRAFKQGMAPIVVGLMLATGLLVARTNAGASATWVIWVLTAVSALVVWRTRLHLLWLLAGGALLGWFGFV